MGEWLRKLMGWLQRDELTRELDEEMRTHIRMKEEDGADSRAVRRDFGNITLLVQDSRAQWGLPRLETWLRDLRYAVRMMARRPGFAATLVLTLALGIGASSAIFSLIDTVVVRPLPYPDSARLVIVEQRRLGEARMVAGVSPGIVEDLERLNQSFEVMAGSNPETYTETTGVQPERLTGAATSPRFFSVFGVPPELGRTFERTEEVYGGPAAVVISDGLWHRRFGADPRVLGRSLVLEKESRVIVGVMPARFQYPAADTEVWVPKQVTPGLMQIREDRFYEGIARLRAGVSLHQATADLDGVQQRLAKQFPKTDEGWEATVQPLKDFLLGTVKDPLWLLFGSATLLLLIACANVACLLLGQLNGRAPEIATRCALGAGRTVIARQLLAEALAYAVVGGLVGMGLAFGGVDVMRSNLAQLPRIAELTVNARAPAVAAAVTLLALMLFSVMPVAQVFRRDPRAALAQGGRGIVGGNRFERLLVSAQIALATVLLIGAGLFLRSLLKLEDTPLGFHPEHILTLHVSASYSEKPESATQRHQRIMAALSALPGVTSVAMSAGIAGTATTWPTEFHIAGEPEPSSVKRFARQRVVTSAYFQTLGIPIISGETCRMETGLANPFAALVNRKFADRFLPGRNPIGHTIVDNQLAVPMQVVGVTGDVNEDGHGKEPQPIVYSCGYLRWWPDSDFLIQTRGDPAAMASAVRETVRNLDPGRAVYAVTALTSLIDRTLAPNRFRTLLVGLFSVLALLLATVGLYGVIAFMVTERTREIGIRVAMGARPGQIVSEILRSGVRMTAAGAAIGVVLAIQAARLAGTLLYGVRPLDGITYVTAAAVLLATALLACLIPGRRAASIDPVRALRDS